MEPKSLGTLLQSALYEAENEGARDYLRNHPGYAFDLLDSDDARNEFERGSVLCESPIEREMLAALLSADWSFFNVLPPRVWNIEDRDAVRPRSDVIIIPQMRVARYRLDFAISFPRAPLAAVVAVECDGRDFHDAAADRERDIQLGHLGIVTKRFSGSEIRQDARACAGKVTALIADWSGL